MKVWVIMERDSEGVLGEPIAVISSQGRMERFLEVVGDIEDWRNIIEVAEVYMNPPKILNTDKHRFLVTICEDGPYVESAFWVPPETSFAENRWKEDVFLDGMPAPNCVGFGVKAKDYKEAGEIALTRYGFWLEKQGEKERDES